MKILKEGRLPETLPYIGTCSNCKTVARAEKGELKLTHDQRNGTDASAPCPFCKLIMYFHPEATPPHAPRWCVLPPGDPT